MNIRNKVVEKDRNIDGNGRCISAETFKALGYFARKSEWRPKGRDNSKTFYESRGCVLSCDWTNEVARKGEGSCPSTQSTNKAGISLWVLGRCQSTSGIHTALESGSKKKKNKKKTHSSASLIIHVLLFFFAVSFSRVRFSSSS